jgi:alpha-ribazole phosphatase
MSGQKPDTVLDNTSKDVDAKQISSESESSTSLKPSTSQSSTSITTVELLRNGALKGDDTFRGVTDDALSNSGWEQMVSALDDKNEWDIIITSPLSSCREFTEVIAQEEEIDLEINKQLKEIDFGDWEDHTLEELVKNDADLLNAWWQSPTQITPPNGEDFYDFRARVLKAFKALLDEYQGKRILIVTHSGVIRVILMSILGMQDANLFRLNVDYASYSKFNIDTNDISGLGTLIEHR